MSEAPEELRKQIFQETRDLAKKISGEELELLQIKMTLEEWLKEGRNAEVEEGRAKVTAGGRVTRQAVAGSRRSEAEVELRLADVNGRRGTEDTVVAWSGFTRQATAAFQSAGTEGNLPSVEESDRRKSKGTDETVAVGGGHSSEMEGAFLLCEVGGHHKVTENEQRPVQAKAPPQKRAVRVEESAETQDYVSEPQWNGEENEEEMEELCFIPSAVEPQ